ncbi:MAG: helicase-related protein [Alphaproteobacteria bacterium]
MTDPDTRPRVTAILGPTNTGKTHMAVERMLTHRTGMMGFPLRLLARENYDKVVALKGARAVALVTGEERIEPPEARYFLCTVEAMPERETDFLAVDEIQLAADRERGHVFTDRLLNARGREETMFVGADAIRALIRRLVPGIEIIARPRFSTLRYAGAKKLARLPPRSAVVAFSVEDVYAIAEFVRRRRGGTAVVMGALSPRTRNAQAGMFQAGEVDFMVATDAIGMGLNMDLDHVFFARRAKFDGWGMRRLLPAELAQIAGRAGRHLRDGDFGVTGDLGPFEPEVVEAIEEHRFPPLETLQWRNASLDFRSTGALLASLERRPEDPQLMRAREADDHLALAALARDGEVAALAQGQAAVRLLWQVCQVPDFRKTLSEAHTGLLARIYGHLMGPARRLPEEWIARQIARLDRTDGDIDSLTQRIAHVRTWTYVSHRGDWVADPVQWQERARAIEDRLSNALHERLTERFVDRRSAALVRRMERPGPLIGAVRDDGEVVVEGEHVGRLDGFRFVADAEGGDMAPALQAAHRALRAGMGRRVKQFEAEDDAAFALDDDGRLLWRGAPVARLERGPEPMKPGLRLRRTDLLDSALQARVVSRLARWLERHLSAPFGPLARLAASELPPGARGLAFRLAEALGGAVRLDGPPPVGAERSALTRLGVRFVARHAYLVGQEASARLRALLWAIHHGAPLPAPVPSAASVMPLPGWKPGFYAALGYIEAGPRLVRAERLQRLEGEARKLGAQGEFVPMPAMARIVGGSMDELAPALSLLGFRKRQTEHGLVFMPPGGMDGKKKRRRGKPPAPARPRDQRPPDPHSPFAALKGLKIAR